MKIIKLKDETHQALAIRKAELNVSTFDDVIAALLCASSTSTTRIGASTATEAPSNGGDITQSNYTGEASK